LHCDLESYRRDLIRQSIQFNSEKSIFQQRTAALEDDKRNLHRQIEEANLKNQSLQVKLDQTEKSLKQIMRNCESFSKEREELHHSLDELKSKFDNEMTHAQQQFDIHTQKSLEFVLYIDELNQQLKETQSAKKALEQYIHEVNEQKLGLGQSMTALEQRGSAACNGK
jgi:chromosome segregation ATPase